MNVRRVLSHCSDNSHIGVWHRQGHSIAGNYTPEAGFAAPARVVAISITLATGPTTNRAWLRSVNHFTQAHKHLDDGHQRRDDALAPASFHGRLRIGDHEEHEKLVHRPSQRGNTC